MALVVVVVVVVEEEEEEELRGRKVKIRLCFESLLALLRP